MQHRQLACNGCWQGARKFAVTLNRLPAQQGSLCPNKDLCLPLSRSYMAIQREEEGVRMLRMSHKPLFRNGAINDVHDIFGWRAYARGESEVLLKNAWPPNPRLRKCEILPLCTASI